MADTKEVWEPLQCGIYQSMGIAERFTPQEGVAWAILGNADSNGSGHLLWLHKTLDGAIEHLLDIAGLDGLDRRYAEWKRWFPRNVETWELVDGVDGDNGTLIERWEVGD